jgi:RNA polymerase sigma-70 factor (ECF subfamily)
MESDEELYRRTRAGDMTAFDALYERYEVPLFGFLLGQLRSTADAEEALCEAFMKALQSPEPTLAAGGFRAWLYRIARNHALNLLRSRKRGERAIASLLEPPPTGAADEALEDHQRQVALEGAVGRLPPSLSELYRLRTSGLSYQEMAAVLEIPLGTLKSRMHLMVTQLREELRAWTAR